MKIILYSKDGCAPCVTVKKYLDRKALKYEERNIKLDKWQKKLWEDHSSMTVPTLAIGEHTIIGPNIGEITRVLRLIA